MQVEESYIGADQFCSLVRQDSQTVLRNELNVLHGLKFDLITHPPLRSLQGLFQACLSVPFPCVSANPSTGQRCLHSNCSTINVL
jgi:hypothetical protein